jgi:hypothetical protein
LLPKNSYTVLLKQHPLLEEAIHQSLVVRHRFNVSNVLNN